MFRGSSFRPRLESLEERVTPVSLPSGFTENLVTGNLAAPTSMAFAPDGRLFVTEQGGNVRVIKNGQLLANSFVSLTVDSSGERGALGLAFDPSFANNQFVYVYYTVPGTPAHNRVSRFTANGDVAVSGSELPILDLDNLGSATNHNGGAIHFGADGKLYVAVGENATSSNSQTLNNRLGKMLRINSDGTIPSDNPFFNSATGANRSIWALGLRNPFTFAVDDSNGRIFINDVGQSSWEEINDGIAGSNYGWPTHEGIANDPLFRDPLFAYTHNNMVDPHGIAITGGDFYRPTAQSPFPADFVGDYFFADLGSNWIWKYDIASDTATAFATSLTGSSPVDIDVSTNGVLYYLSHAGAVYRIDYVAGPVLAVGAAAGGTPHVKLIDTANGNILKSFLAYAAGFGGGVRVAMGDVNGDGFDDVITAAGAGGGPHIKVFDGLTGAVIRSFFAYDSGFLGGVFVAAGDVNGDGKADIITGAGPGGGPHVKVFDGVNGNVLKSFFAYSSAFTGGVTVAAGDTSGDAKADIITGAGPGGGPHVKVFDAVNNNTLHSFFAFGASFTGGIFVSAGDINHDTRADLIVGQDSGGTSNVRVFSGVNHLMLLDFLAYAGFSGGARVGAVDMNSDGNVDIIAGAGPSGGPHVKVFDGTNPTNVLLSFFAFDPSFQGGVYVG